MFDFIKKLLRKEPEQRLLTLNADDLGSWLAGERQEREKRLAEFLQSWLREWKDTMGACRERLVELEHAKLRNPDIPAQHKHFMEGNRREFNRRVVVFLERIQTPQDIGHIQSFLDTWKREMPDLVKGIARPSAILGEFLAVQAGNVQKGLGALETKVTELAAEQDKELPAALTRLKKVLEEKINDTSKMTDLQHQLAATRKRLDAERNTLSTIQKKIKTIEASKEHQHIKQLREELTATQAQLKVKIGDITSVMLSLDDALARYHYATGSKFIDDVRKAPLAAFEHHGDKLVDLCAEIKGAIERGSLDLKDKKREKALNVTGMMTRAWHAKEVAVLHDLRAKESHLIKSIDTSGVVQELVQLHKSERDTSENIKRMTDEAGFADAKLARIHLTAYDNEFVKLAEQLGVRITLAGNS